MERFRIKVGKSAPLMTMENVVESIRNEFICNRSGGLQQVEEVLETLDERMRVYLTRRRAIFNVLQHSEQNVQ
jgi:hypothetical protein